MMGDVVAPPLGLAQLAGCLEQAGTPVEILDANALAIGWDELEAAIAEHTPDVIGMTVYTPYVPEVGRAVRAARAACPSAKIVLGGPHTTFTAAASLEDWPEVDIIARGEGERTIVALAEALAGRGALGDVPGITYRRNGRESVAAPGSGDSDGDGALVETPLAPPVDVERLPNPAFHLLPMDRYVFPALGGPFATVLTSRGCPFKCSFCAEWPFWRNGWRAHDPEMVIEQLDVLANQYGRTNIWMGDDCFNVSAEHIEAICEGILARGLSVEWFYQGRADMVVRHKHLLPLMRRAGNRLVQLGIEASTDAQRDELDKQLDTRTVEEAVRLLRRHDIVCQGMIIVGVPSDSPATFSHKVRFAKRLGIDQPVFTFYTLFPGAIAFDEAVAQGLLEMPCDYGTHDMGHAVLPTRHMTRSQVWYYTGWSFARFYLDPFYMARGLITRNVWRRRIYARMLGYIGKQVVKSFIPRIG
jgi:anaerobic magnesium-protoporphyrin IX monomethyl ester cyclase